MKKPIRSRRRSRAQTGIVIFTTCTLCLSSSAASDAVALGKHRDDDETSRRADSSSDSLLERVHEAITDASRPLHPVQRERNTQSRWGPRLKKWRHSIAGMLSSSSAVSHAVVAPREEPSAKAPLKQERKEKRPTRISDTGDMFDYEMHEGARLISSGFGVLSNTFGLLADGVRISGDTAAGFVGSSVRLMGTAVKSVSGSFESAGRALEPKEEERRKVLTSERLRERQLGKGDGDDDFRHGRVLPNVRSAASQSVRYVISDGFVDKLLRKDPFRLNIRSLEM